MPVIIRSILSCCVLVSIYLTPPLEANSSISNANNASSHQCDSLTPQPQLNLQKFQGIWREYQFLKYEGMELHRRLNYRFDNHTNKTERCAQNFNLQGNVMQQPPTGLFNTLLFDTMFLLMVLETDYKNYAVVTPCYYGLPSNDKVIVIPETVLVLSRNKTPPADTIQPITKCLQRNGISTGGLTLSEPYNPMNIFMYVDKLNSDLGVPPGLKSEL